MSYKKSSHLTPLDCFLYAKNEIYNERIVILVHLKENKRYGHTAHTFSRLLSDILIWEKLLLATQINWYAIWWNKMKFMEVG